MAKMQVTEKMEKECYSATTVCHRTSRCDGLSLWPEIDESLVLGNQLVLTVEDLCVRSLDSRESKVPRFEVALLSHGKGQSVVHPGAGFTNCPTRHLGGGRKLNCLSGESTSLAEVLEPLLRCLWRSACYV